MTGYLPMKMKRKDFEEVYDDFSDFSLSSPARKIRRLDAELAPIIEEEESGVPLEIDVEEPLQVIEREEVVPVNEERALVLYKPVNSACSDGPGSSNVWIKVNEELFPGFKDQAFWTNSTNLSSLVEDKVGSSYKSHSSNNCLAVVPWVSNQLPTAAELGLPVAELSEPMESEDTEAGAMEIETDSVSEEQTGKTSGFGEAEGLQRWQQQHCLTPQLPPNTSAPVMWSW